VTTEIWSTCPPIFFANYCMSTKVLGWLRLKILMERPKKCSFNIDGMKSILVLFKLLNALSNACLSTLFFFLWWLVLSWIFTICHLFHHCFKCFKRFFFASTNLFCIHYSWPNKFSLFKKKFIYIYIYFIMLCLDYQVLLQLALMAKWNERPTVLVEDIDHTIHNVAFDCLVLSVYGNSSLFGSLAKSIAYSYLHANVIDYVGITTIIVNINEKFIGSSS